MWCECRRQRSGLLLPKTRVLTDLVLAARRHYSPRPLVDWRALMLGRLRAEVRRGWAREWIANDVRRGFRRRLAGLCRVAGLRRGARAPTSAARRLYGVRTLDLVLAATAGTGRGRCSPSEIIVAARDSCAASSDGQSAARAAARITFSRVSLAGTSAAGLRIGRSSENALVAIPPIAVGHRTSRSAGIKLDSASTGRPV